MQADQRSKCKTFFKIVYGPLSLSLSNTSGTNKNQFQQPKASRYIGDVDRPCRWPIVERGTMFTQQNHRHISMRRRRPRVVHSKSNQIQSMRLALFHERHFGIWQSLAPSIDFHCAHLGSIGIALFHFFFLEIFRPDDFEKVECGAHHSQKKI